MTISKNKEGLGSLFFVGQYPPLSTHKGVLQLLVVDAEYVNYEFSKKFIIFVRYLKNSK